MKTLELYTGIPQADLSVSAAFERMFESTESGTLEQVRETQTMLVQSVFELFQILNEKGVLTVDDLNRLRPMASAYYFKEED